MNKIKFIIIEIIRGFLKNCFIVPIKQNRVLFSAYSGKQYSCNPKYISEYLLKNYGDDVEIIWAFNSPDNFCYLDKRIKRVKFKSIKFIYYALTSKVVVDNVESWSILPKKNNQIVINTWHGGGAYKGVGLKRNDSNDLMDKNMLNKNKRISLYISSSKAFTQMTLRDSFKYLGDVLECGMPRNDIFFNKNSEDVVRKIKEKYKLKKEKLFLYAPTFRKDLNYQSSLDMSRLLSTLSESFGGEWKILYRGHYYLNDNNKLKSNNIIDVTDYPDMQELLLTADVLMTDYSSSMWDFSFTGKPCFLYADDLNSYDKEREFYTPITSWPFPLALNNSDLEKNIKEFDNDTYHQNIEKHHKDLGSFESGKASMIVGEKIIKFLQIKNIDRK